MSRYNDPTQSTIQHLDDTVTTEPSGIASLKNIYFRYTASITDTDHFTKEQIHQEIIASKIKVLHYNGVEPHRGIQISRAAIDSDNVLPILLLAQFGDRYRTAEEFTDDDNHHADTEGRHSHVPFHPPDQEWQNWSLEVAQKSLALDDRQQSEDYGSLVWHVTRALENRMKDDTHFLTGSSGPCKASTDQQFLLAWSYKYDFTAADRFRALISLGLEDTEAVNAQLSQWKSTMVQESLENQDQGT